MSVFLTFMDYCCACFSNEIYEYTILIGQVHIYVVNSFPKAEEEEGGTEVLFGTCCIESTATLAQKSEALPL